MDWWNVHHCPSPAVKSEMLIDPIGLTGKGKSSWGQGRESVPTYGRKRPESMKFQDFSYVQHSESRVVARQPRMSCNIDTQLLVCTHRNHFTQHRGEAPFWMELGSCLTAHGKTMQHFGAWSEEEGVQLELLGYWGRRSAGTWITRWLLLLLITPQGLRGQT